MQSETEQFNKELHKIADHRDKIGQFKQHRQALSRSTYLIEHVLLSATIIILGPIAKRTQNSTNIGSTDTYINWVYLLSSICFCWDC